MLPIRQEQIPQARGAAFGLEFLNYGRRQASLDLIVVALLNRINVLIHEDLQAPLQVLHFAAEREIHVCRLSPIYP